MLSLARGGAGGVGRAGETGEAGLSRGILIRSRNNKSGRRSRWIGSSISSKSSRKSE